MKKLNINERKKLNLIISIHDNIIRLAKSECATFDNLISYSDNRKVLDSMSIIIQDQRESGNIK